MLRKLYHNIYNKWEYKDNKNREFNDKKNQELNYKINEKIKVEIIPAFKELFEDKEISKGSYEQLETLINYLIYYTYNRYALRDLRMKGTMKEIIELIHLIHAPLFKNYYSDICKISETSYADKKIHDFNFLKNTPNHNDSLEQIKARLYKGVFSLLELAE